jgi:RNA polymerase sigma-B factor
MAPVTSSRPAREGDAFRRFARDRDPALRGQLIESSLPLAHAIAGRFARRHPDLSDELRQVAAIGLIKAVDRYEPERGSAFSTFAVPTIQGEIRRYFRDQTWAVRVPRGLQERAVRVESDRDALTEQLGRSPTPRELAEWTGDTVEDVLDAIHAMRARTGDSLDRPIDRDDDSGGRLGDVLGAEDDGIAAAEDRASLAPLLGQLTRRERVVLHLYVEEDMSQREIGRRLGCSQMHVSRIYRRAVARLREAPPDRSLVS